MKSFNIKQSKNIILAIAIIFASQIAYAEETSPNGNNNGISTAAKVFSYAPSPSHQGVVYAFSGNNALVKSEDSGLTWKEVDTLGNENFSVIVRSFHPYRGRSSIPNSRGVDSVLRVDAVDSQTLYAINNDVLSKSSDGGIHWRKVSNKLNIDPGSFFLLNPQPMTPLLKGLVYTNNAINSEKRLATSIDGGENWILAENIIQDAEGQTIAIEGIDQKNPLVLYGTNLKHRLDSSGIFDSSLHSYSYNQPEPFILHKSIDGGLTWFEIQPPNSRRYSGNLKIHPTNSNILYAQFNPISPEGASLPAKYMRSEDGGVSWEFLAPIDSDLERKIAPLTLDPTNINIIYADLVTPRSSEWNITQIPNMIAKSIDSGRSWEIIPMEGSFESFSGPFFAGQGVVVNPLNNQNLFYRSDSNVPVSYDGGISWNKNPSKVKDCLQLIVNPQKDQNYLCRKQDSLYRSFDSGNTWSLSQVLAIASYIGQIHYANDGKTIYYLGGVWFFKSTDNGESWDNINNSNFIFQPFWTGPNSIKSHDVISKSLFLVDPEDSNTLYIFNGRDLNADIGIYKSTDGGKNWTNQLDITHTPFTFFQHPSRPQRLLVLAEFNPIHSPFLTTIQAFLSDDGGNNWTQLPQSFTDKVERNKLFLPNPNYKGLVFNPKNPDGILSSFSNDLYETTDLGKTWKKVAKGFTSDLRIISDKVYSIGAGASYSLTPPVISMDAKNCLFNWAEKTYPDYFSPALAGTQQTDDYAYRFYNDTNTYLGVFQDKKVHMLEADLTEGIKDVGYFEYFQHLAGCD